jgi:hypothetical protein
MVDTQGAEVLCVELGVYTSAATGQSFVVAEVQAVCTFFGQTGPVEQACNSAQVVGEVSNGGGYVSDGASSCSGDCQASRSYFYPLGSFPHNVCMNNIWAAVELGSQIEYSRAQPDTLLVNVATPHFNYCPGKGFTRVS